MSDLQTLKDFLVLARLKSFSKAAEHCHVTTSGLSRRIQNLELWLGAPVFDRGKPQLDLTTAGAQLHTAASEAVASLEAVRNSVRRQADEQASQIRLAAPHIMSGTFFPGWLSRLHTQFGQARFTVTSALLPDCLRSLERGEVDFVVTYEDGAGGIRERLERDTDWSSAESLELGSEWLLPTSAPGIRGEPQHRVDGAHGGALSFLGYSDECSLSWALNKALAQMPGLPPLQRQHENSLADGLRSMALIGMGVAWLPESLVREDISSRKLVPAGREEHAVHLRVLLLRRPLRLGARAEALWERLCLETGPVVDSTRGSRMQIPSAVLAGT